MRVVFFFFLSQIFSKEIFTTVFVNFILRLNQHLKDFSLNKTNIYSILILLFILEDCMNVV